MSIDTPVQIPVARGILHADLHAAPGARAIAVFVHGSGSDRHSPRNRAAAAALHAKGFASLLIDLLTPEEAVADARHQRFRFDLILLAERVVAAIDWLADQDTTRDLRVALVAASTGAAAALRAAAQRSSRVAAIAARGGRADLAGEAALDGVAVPTQWVVGGEDHETLASTRKATARLKSGQIVVVPGATHLFAEPGALDQAVEQMCGFLAQHT